MGIQTIEKNLDFISLNYQFSRNGNPEIAKYLRDEIAAQIIAATTLKHNRWASIPGRKNIIRGSGGFSLLFSSNKIIIQASGEAMLFLDEFDIKDIFNRTMNAIKSHRRFDFEQAMEAEPTISIGRLDSQITVAIQKPDIDSFFSFNEKAGSGRSREFRQVINGESILTAKYWIKNREIDIYAMKPEKLKKTPQTLFKKRDFVRIYDKLLEVVDTTLPHSDKRSMLIEKYGSFISKDTRIFRIEVQEMDRGLTRHMNDLFNEDSMTFADISAQRMQRFAERNPFKMWSDLLPEGPGPSVQKKSAQAPKGLG